MNFLLVCSDFAPRRLADIENALVCEQHAEAWRTAAPGLESQEAHGPLIPQGSWAAAPTWVETL